MGRHGQASIELTAVLGMALIVIIVYAVSASGILTSISVQQNYDDAYNSVQALSQAADSVFAQGEGAAKAVQINLPTNTVFSSNRTYIGKPPGSSASSNTINININGTDVFAVTRAPLSGSFPSEPGEYIVWVVSKGRQVAIGSFLVEAEPSSLYIKAKPGEAKQAPLLVKVASDQQVNVTMASSTLQSYANMSFTPNHFISNGAASVPVILNFTTPGNATGNYLFSLAISAYSVGEPGKYAPGLASVPITLEVS